jgi:hypothetical protein
MFNPPQMRIFALVIASLSLLLAGVPAQVPTVITARNVKIDQILPSVVTSPEFQVRNTTDKRSEYLKWFEIEVAFEIDAIDLVDELTLKYEVLFNGKLYPGEITHVNIPKGRPRYSVMYISPRNLDRMTGGKPLSAGMVENVWITISKQGQILAQKSLRDKGKAVPNLPQVQGFLSPKSETPFQVLWWDRYEAVKIPPR